MKYFIPILAILALGFIQDDSYANGFANVRQVNVQRVQVQRVVNVQRVQVQRVVEVQRVQQIRQVNVIQRVQNVHANSYCSNAICAPAQVQSYVQPVVHQQVYAQQVYAQPIMASYVPVPLIVPAYSISYGSGGNGAVTAEIRALREELQALQQGLRANRPQGPVIVPKP